MSFNFLQLFLSSLLATIHSFVRVNAIMFMLIIASLAEQLAKKFISLKTIRISQRPLFTHTIFSATLDAF